ncbi:maltose ABC transporter substrate-binding protein [Deinococcus pimensis]|uniref:sugar ABC transporter substrate-binding protein n=1 Tax=Deinococcus pimensis TaxID=309888 RepID=UPI000480461B|nr:maltose ABC transporter substrate-binding protein [Deinococcus pimensis]
MKRHLARLLTVSVSSLIATAGAADINVWSHLDGPELAWLKIQATNFETVYGHHVVITSAKFDVMRDKFIADAPKGLAPDLLVTQPQDRISAFVDAKVIEPMDRYVTNKDDLLKVAVDAMTYQGRMYAVPMYAETVALVYNKALVPTPPASWDALVRAAQNDVQRGRGGLIVDVANAYMTFGVTSAFGGYVFKNNGGKLDVNNIGIANDGAVRAARALADLRLGSRVVPATYDGGAARKQFFDGKAAFFVTGPWDMGEIKRSGLDFGIMPMPAPTGATGKWRPFVGVQGIMMNAYSKQKSVAAQFATFLASEGAQVSFGKTSASIPVSSAALDKMRADPVLSAFTQIVKGGISMPNVREMGDVWGPWQDALKEATTKPGADVAKILADAEKTIRASFKKK